MGRGGKAGNIFGTILATCFLGWVGGWEVEGCIASKLRQRNQRRVGGEKPHWQWYDKRVMAWSLPLGPREAAAQVTKPLGLVRAEVAGG